MIWPKWNSKSKCWFPDPGLTRWTTVWSLSLVFPWQPHSKLTLKPQARNSGGEKGAGQPHSWEIICPMWFLEIAHGHWGILPVVVTILSNPLLLFPVFPLTWPNGCQWVDMSPGPLWKELSFLSHLHKSNNANSSKNQELAIHYQWGFWARHSGEVGQSVSGTLMKKWNLPDNFCDFPQNNKEPFYSGKRSKLYYFKQTGFILATSDQSWVYGGDIVSELTTKRLVPLRNANDKEAMWQHSLAPFGFKESLEE